MFKVENLSAGYGKAGIIENISFEINAGELVGVLGANGSGKSTLAKAICNILPHDGKVEVCGQQVEKLSANEVSNLISYISQKSGIGIDISVLDVVLMGFNSRLGLLESPGNEMKNRALAALERVGLSDKADFNYLLLSEGQKQLVIFARALVKDAYFLIMDEPESALDFNVRYKVLDIVKDWVRGEERAGLVILHDTMLALNECDRLILLKDKKIDGVIELKSDTIESMEKKLAQIYGEISLIETQTRGGKRRLVMICDSQGVL